MTTIFLLRHGEYENPLKILPSRMKGFPLSHKGRVQIESVAKLLKGMNIATIYASPILRTKQSARIIAELLGVPLHFCRSLIEVYAPGLQGKPEVITKEIEAYGDTFKFPLHINSGGESVESIYRRMRRIITRSLLRHEGKAVLLVSHGDPIMIASLLESGRSIDSLHSIHEYGPYVPKSGLIRMDYRLTSLIKLTRINY